MPTDRVQPVTKKRRINKPVGGNRVRRSTNRERQHRQLRNVPLRDASLKKTPGGEDKDPGDKSQCSAPPYLFPTSRTIEVSVCMCACVHQPALSVRKNCAIDTASARTGGRFPRQLPREAPGVPILTGPYREIPSSPFLRFYVVPVLSARNRSSRSLS